MDSDRCCDGLWPEKWEEGLSGEPGLKRRSTSFLHNANEQLQELAVRKSLNSRDCRMSRTEMWHNDAFGRVGKCTSLLCSSCSA